MSIEILWLILSSTVDTLYMVGVAALLGTLFGLPIGVFLATSASGELFAAPVLNRIVGAVVNATRSTPFIILVVAIIPFTRFVAGTSIGTRAAIVPLTIAATPFIARIIESAIREVDHGLNRGRARHGGHTAADRAQGADRRSAAAIVLG